MPTYQYKREDGSTFEIIQKMSDDALQTCPETGQKVKRIITGGGGVVYKGDGWYVTDYKNKTNGNGSAAKASEGKSASTADGGRTETSADGNGSAASRSNGTKASSNGTTAKDSSS